MKEMLTKDILRIILYLNSHVWKTSIETPLCNIIGTIK